MASLEINPVEELARHLYSPVWYCLKSITLNSKMMLFLSFLSVLSSLSIGNSTQTNSVRLDRTAIAMSMRMSALHWITTSLPSEVTTEGFRIITFNSPVGNVLKLTFYNL